MTGKVFAHRIEEPHVLNWSALKSKADAIRQRYAFGSFPYDKVS